MTVPFLTRLAWSRDMNGKADGRHRDSDRRDRDRDRDRDRKRERSDREPGERDDRDESYRYDLELPDNEKVPLFYN